MDHIKLKIYKIHFYTGLMLTEISRK